MKPVGIISASPGLLGGVRAQYHLRQILVALNAQVINQPEIMISEVMNKFDEKENLTDEKTKKFIRSFISSLAVFTDAIKKGAATEAAKQKGGLMNEILN
jgi:chromate reductase